MAQPVFDQHPLEDYFRHTGETSEPMPGGSPDFVVEEDDLADYDLSSSEVDFQISQFVVRVIQIANELLQTSSYNSGENSFEERFKYDVISSSLLASALAAPTHAIRRSFTPELPGKLDDTGGGRDDEHIFPDGKTDDHFPDSTPPSQFLGPQLPVALLSLAVVALSTGFIFFPLVLLAAAIYGRYVSNADQDKHNSTMQTLDALNDLISAGNVWDSAVSEAISLIEKEERSIFYGPTSNQAPSSALRIALRSSLHTTQTQCDNVRQLLSALTCPASLSQMTEMYAPSSPIRASFSLGDSQRSPSSSSNVRPFSHPSATWRQRNSSPPNSNINKRATWNGSYAALALAGSPTAHLANRKKQNRRSDVLSLFQPPSGTALASVSAPVTPEPPSPVTNNRLEDVLEEEDHDHAAEELESKGYFGAAALDLQRKRKSVGLETFGLPPPSYTPPRSPVRAGRKGRPLSMLSPTIASSSRLTSVHTTRHPLSLSGLYLALQGALASKRYACSHLLALRFTDDEDDSYWENVRSVMALLSSTFSDASSRLVEALDDAEKRRIKDEHPTPPRGNSPTPYGRENGKERERCASPLRNSYAPTSSLLEMISFAPMPSNMARFAGHIEAINAAMNDARDHIDECIAALRGPSVHSDSEDSIPSIQDHPAFQAYDRLRKELGFALRECERGRERLLDILAGPRSSAEPEDEEASPNTPGLKHDSGSETSERDPVSPNLHGGESKPGLGLTLSLEDQDQDQDQDLDDASTHLLLTTSSQHLPPPGAEQVFEAESGNTAAFTRARSKLTREERIKIMRARRATGLPLSTSSSIASPDLEAMERPGKERWGPGGEVVQELKDVIWKVGEKRRKMSQQLQTRLPQEHPHPREQVLQPERETSILIDVDVGSPIGAERISEHGEEQDSDLELQPQSEPVPEPERSHSPTLDSPSPQPSQPLNPHAHLCLVPDLDLDDTPRTAPQLSPAPAPAPASAAAEPENGLDMS